MTTSHVGCLLVQTVRGLMVAAMDDETVVTAAQTVLYLARSGSRRR